MSASTSRHPQKKPAEVQRAFRKQLCISAEREGFEPPVPLSTPVFKTGAFDHSAISPKVRPQGFEPWTL